MSKRFLLVMAVFVAIFAGILIVNRDASAPSPDAEPTQHVYGEGKSGVSLVEYGDFQCPACFGYFPIVSQLKEKYKEQITFEFRHFPIVSAHPNAMAAHRAAEAASRQGKFWEMHDLLFSRQKNWESINNPVSVFEGYATELGLNVDQFRQDASSTSVADSIHADQKRGEDSGVQGTPGFILDGKLIENPASLEAFEALIEESIKQKTTS